VFSPGDDLLEVNKITKMRGEMTGRVRRRRLFAIAIAAAAVASVSLNTQESQAARGLDLGFVDRDFVDDNAATRDLALDRAVQARAGTVLLYVDWSRVAPLNRPASFDPTDPADPHYHFDAIDDAVHAARARGLRILMAFTRAPSWAEGPGRPSESLATPGSWRPNANDVGDFTRAIATRYSGNFMGLPAVRHWQLWAEPNLGLNLSPQFEGGRAEGFEIYRGMLNAFYTQLKAVSPQNTVVTGGTAPYGNLFPTTGPVYQRMQPLAFWRGLLCLQSGKGKKKGRKKKGKKGAAARAGGNLTPLPCPAPAHFDIAAHNPINVGRPTRAARNRDDISTPDLAKLKRVLRAAGRSGRALPGGPKPIWATEIYWSSNPPNPNGLPLRQQARFLEQGFYILWKQGVQTAIWFQVRDLVRTGGPIPTSGLFLREGGEKPAFQAYRFPFVAERLTRQRVRVWGIAPQPGKVSIRAGKRRLKSLGAGANRVFVGTLRLRSSPRLRARQGSETSLSFRPTGK
jgi:hypothetical protein